MKKVKMKEWRLSDDSDRLTRTSSFWLIAMIRITKLLKRNFKARRTGGSIFPFPTGETFLTYDVSGQEVIVSFDEADGDLIEVLFDRSANPEFVKEVKTQLDNMNFWI